MATSSSLRNISSIPTLSQLYRAGTLIASTKTGLPEPRADFNEKICTIQTDITKLQIDAIVNAANARLGGGLGVNGAIQNAAGPKLLEACLALGGCPTGSAKITDAFDLPCKKVIHAVGPVYKNDAVSEPLLRGAYRTSLQVAVDNDCKSVAFCAISTGIYGYPNGSAARVALTEVKKFLEKPDGQKLDKVIFVNFLKKDVDLYSEYLPEVFPPVQEDLKTVKSLSIEGKKQDINSPKQSMNLVELRSMEKKKQEINHRKPHLISSHHRYRLRMLTAAWVELKSEEIPSSLLSEKKKRKFENEDEDDESSTDLSWSESDQDTVKVQKNSPKKQANDGNSSKEHSGIFDTTKPVNGNKAANGNKAVNSSKTANNGKAQGGSNSTKSSKPAKKLNLVEEPKSTKKPKVPPKSEPVQISKPTNKPNLANKLKVVQEPNLTKRHKPAAKNLPTEEFKPNNKPQPTTTTEPVKALKSVKQNPQPKEANPLKIDKAAKEDKSSKNKKAVKADKVTRVSNHSPEVLGRLRKRQRKD